METPERAPHASENGRGDWIRTSDPHTPSVMRYQAALRPDRLTPYGDARAAHLVPRASLGKAARGVIGARHFLRMGPTPRALSKKRNFQAMTTTSLLAAAAADAPSGTALLIWNTLPFVVILFIVWFLMLRPQHQRMKEHQAQIQAVKKGDRVVTGGGLIGKVTKVGDTEVEVELAQGVRVQVVKSTLSQVGSAASAKPAND